MDKLLAKDKIVIVTGSAGGIGKATAIMFAREGAKAVYVVDMAEEKAQDTIAQISAFCDCHFKKTNIADEASVKELFDDVKKAYGRLDALVNCAGIIGLDNLYEMTIDSYEKIMKVNLTGTLLMAREAMLMMKEQKGGTIVSMASIAGQVGGIRTNPAYSCSKAGILCYTKALAKDGAPFGVRVNSIAPGIIVTPMTQDPNFKYTNSEVPLGEAGRADDVAYAVLFLSSYMSAHVTGQCLNVNGGMFMN